MRDEGWWHLAGCVDCYAAGMVARRGEKATDFCGLAGCVGCDDDGGRVGLVKPRRRGVVLVEVAVMWRRVVESDSWVCREKLS